MGFEVTNSVDNARLDPCRAISAVQGLGVSIDLILCQESASFLLKKNIKLRERIVNNDTFDRKIC